MKEPQQQLRVEPALVLRAAVRQLPPAAQTQAQGAPEEAVAPLRRATQAQVEGVGLAQMAARALLVEWAPTEAEAGQAQPLE